MDLPPPPGLLAAIAVLAVGCGGGGDSLDQESDPAAVGKAFIEAMAEGDPAACELMTPKAAHLAGRIGGRVSCEEAIEAESEYLEFSFYGSPAGELTAEFDSGELVETSRGPVYSFCLPNETKIKLGLVELDSNWLVDLVAASQVTAISADDQGIPKPCRLG